MRKRRASVILFTTSPFSLDVQITPSLHLRVCSPPRLSPSLYCPPLFIVSDFNILFLVVAGHCEEYKPSITPNTSDVCRAFVDKEVIHSPPQYFLSPSPSPSLSLNSFFPSSLFHTDFCLLTYYTNTLRRPRRESHRHRFCMYLSFLYF